MMTMMMMMMMMAFFIMCKDSGFIFSWVTKLDISRPTRRNIA